jgi:inorganic triphosphatase YgiF
MTPPPPLEVELKLALPPQQVAAFLKRMARRRSVPVRQELLTRYFDTPEFALSAQGVALRVRRTLKGTRAGRRWLQTLKTEGERQGGLSRRAEFETRVSRGAPDWDRFPPEAQARVPEALRSQLVPVFETGFTRTAWLVRGRGGAQIEVALDEGEVRSLAGTNGGRTQPLCEIELELKAGQPDALFALALEWAGALGCLPLDISKAERGVRLAHGVEAAPVKSVPLQLDVGMSVEDGFVAIVQDCLRQFQANLPGVLASDDIEYVHQARVALRRLRAALRLYRKACVLPAELMDGLRALAAALGPARDWDVLCAETLPAIAPHYVDPIAWEAGRHVLEAHRAEVRRAMQDALGRTPPGAWLLALQRWLLQGGWRAAPEAQRFVQLAPLMKWARRALQRGHRPVVRGARDFAQLQPLQRHALRIAIKRQRYAAEFFQALFAGPPEGRNRRLLGYLAALRDAQDSLGRANDARVAWDLLAAAHVEAGPMEHFALGWLAAKRVEPANGESAAHMQAFLASKPYW